MNPGDLLIDYSYARPDLAQAVKSGAKGVIRYSAGVASDPTNPNHRAVAGKLITPAEFKAILAAGLDVVANDEWYETRITEGHTAGRQDGHAAAALWKDCGLERGSVIYVSWDAAPEPQKYPQVAAYLHGYRKAAKKFGYKVGVYAGTPYLKRALRLRCASKGWRPNAGSWSNDGLPYQPDTATPEARAALVAQALKATPASIWQTGNYWFNRNADEDMVVRAPIGSHLEAVEANKPKPKRHRWFWFPGFWRRWHKAHPGEQPK